MAAEARATFAGHASRAEVARELRTTDVHPPLYFWTVVALRWLAGPACSVCVCCRFCAVSWRW